MNSNLGNDSPDVVYESKFHHLTDPLFSTVAVLTESGSVVERVRYDAYGAARHRPFNDCDGDGDYDSTDRAAIQALVMAGIGGTPISSGGYNADCDLNQDGTVNTADLSLAGTFYTPGLAPGLISSPTAGGGNPYGFAGMVFNPELHSGGGGAGGSGGSGGSGGAGGYLARHRWYSTDLARWFERDPAGYVDGMNVYLYAGANPGVFIDPMGLSWFGDLWEGAKTWVLGNDDLTRYRRSLASSARNIAARLATNRERGTGCEETIDLLMLEEAERRLGLSQQGMTEVDNAILDIEQARADATAAAVTLIPGGAAIATTIEGVNIAVDVGQGQVGDALMRGAGLLGGHALGQLAKRLQHADEAAGELVKQADNVIAGQADDAADAARAAVPDNPTSYSVLSEQPVSGASRQSHRSTANRQLYEQLEQDEAMRSMYDEAFRTDVMAHMQSGRSGLLNPPGAVWHHPFDRGGVVQLMFRGQHVSSRFQNVLHPNGIGGFGKWWR